MFRPRVIPVLLLKDNALVKSVRFSEHRYIGDPIHAVRIFNELKADELVFLDIDASRQKRNISPELIRNIAEEANMPFCVGGGIHSLEQIHKLLSSGVEKVIIGAGAVLRPAFVKEAAEAFGSSTLAVCIDVKKNFFGQERVYTTNGSKASAFTPVEFARLMESSGAGELIIQSIERDGTMLGYDLELTGRVCSAVSIPVVALGGAGNITHLREAFIEAHANGLAAGSMFVYQGTKKGVLINYPDRSEMGF